MQRTWGSRAGTVRRGSSDRPLFASDVGLETRAYRADALLAFPHAAFRETVGVQHLHCGHLGDWFESAPERQLGSAASQCMQEAA
jgi:hypothetical protein